jgi:hypothetical protein
MVALTSALRDRWVRTRALYSASFCHWRADGQGESANLTSRFGTTPHPQKLTIAPIFIADKVSPALSREKDGNCVSLRRLGRCEGRSAGRLRASSQRMERRNRHRRLLSPRRKRPCRRTADQRDELAPLDHSITSSAIASRSGYLPSAIGPAENSGSGCRQAPNTSLVAELDELGRNPEHSIRAAAGILKAQHFNLAMSTLTLHCSAIDLTARVKSGSRTKS